MARIGIIGSEGRMGHALVRAIGEAGHECAGGVDRGGDVAALADRSDALVDFSAPAALEGNLHAAVGAWGGAKLLREEFGIEPTVISGPATDNQVGIDIIKERSSVAAINAMTHAAELGDLLQKSIGLGDRLVKASA